MKIEKYKKELESAIYEGIPDGTYYIGGKVVEKVLKEAINEALAIKKQIYYKRFIMEIKPTKTFTDEKGNWWIEFKSDEVEKAFEKFKPKKKKIWWKFWS